MRCDYCGLRPIEFRKLTWDEVDFGGGVVHVWRSAIKTGDTKTLRSASQDPAVRGDISGSRDSMPSK
jgi:integrase